MSQTQSQSPPTRMAYDPFYDGEQPQVAYTEADAELKLRMPRRAGVAGTVIPKAGIGGVPMGLNPHKVANAAIRIDPRGEDTDSEIRLGTITPAAVAAATAAAAKYTSEPVDIPTHRLRAAAIMDVLTQGVEIPQSNVVVPRDVQASDPLPFATAAPQYQQYQQPPQYQQPYSQQPQYQQPPQPMHPQQPAFVQRQPVAVPSLGQLQANRQAVQAPAPPVQQMAAPQPVVPMPVYRVTFNVENFGVIEASYHDIVVEEFYIVLIFDTRCVHASKHFPGLNNGVAVPLVMGIHGINELRVVRATGIQYTHGNLEHCVLAITDTIQPEGG